MHTRKLVSAVLGLGFVGLAASEVIADCGRCAEDAKAMAASMDAGKLTLAKAADAAAAACKTKVVNVVATKAGDKVAFKAYCYGEGRMHEVTVDHTGKAGTPTAIKSGMGTDAPAAGNVSKAMDDGKLTMASVVTTAETAAKGKALAVTTAMKDNKLNTEVYVLAGDKIMKTEVDATGKAGKTEEAKMLPEAKSEALPKPKGG